MVSSEFELALEQFRTRAASHLAQFEESLRRHTERMESVTEGWSAQAGKPEAAPRNQVHIQSPAPAVVPRSRTHERRQNTPIRSVFRRST